MQQRQGFGSSFMQMMTNTAFKIDYMFSQELKIDEPMTILGQDIQNADFFKQIKDTLIWFSYRANIQYDGKAISDQGWGCLVRVGQMMLANALMRECNVLKINETKTRVIQLFNDNEGFSMKAPYSIQQIIKKASVDYNMKMGDWYTGPKITCILEELNHKYGNFKQLKIINFVEQCLIEKQLDYTFRQPQLIIIHAIIGDKSLDLAGVEKLKKHLKISQFAGAIVGKDKKAFFLLGFQNQNAIFMDPHYVQESGKMTLESTIKCQPLKSLTGTIALSYYISNEIEYHQFKYQLNQIGATIFSIIDKNTDIQYFY